MDPEADVGGSEARGWGWGYPAVFLGSASGHAGPSLVFSQELPFLPGVTLGWPPPKKCSQEGGTFTSQVPSSCLCLSLPPSEEGLETHLGCNISSLRGIPHPPGCPVCEGYLGDKTLLQ